MNTHIKVGDIDVFALSDGLSRLPRMFYPGLDFDAHPEVLDEDGTVHIPTGCFLIRTGDRNVLVDAGLGPMSFPYPEGMPGATAKPGEPQPFMSEGGLLPSALAKVGCQAEDIDTVFLTHLHTDHVGWVAPGGVPHFPNARVVFGEADWEPLVVNAAAEDPGKASLEGAHAAQRTDPIDGDMVSIAPGVTARHAPGHTPGHYVLIIASGVERAYLLGDAVQCPLQLTDTDISFLTDVDPGLANRTREALFREIENEQAAVGMDHFPGLEFQRILPGVGRSWTTF
jgi:glyoxylase-like metal-dependent hydrolase (beta-lactamase superfamily II)